ncbi:F-box/LRR-repeat protein 2 [Protobothrops mucrosquamatus]|uniref:F-box/LRR-repeat protein 2 n=1 Tax=Protobothrops mucrosquamatus TaxID=103944 RepID=UPI000775A44E|nr:F-box/LRR-repeat protein 2 [Protobothrops mucrosquamatus]
MHPPHAGRGPATSGWALRTEGSSLRQSRIRLQQLRNTAANTKTPPFGLLQTDLAGKHIILERYLHICSPLPSPAPSLPLQVITYILNFLPISDRKEASLVSRAWYFAAQDSLRQHQPQLTTLDLRGCSELSDRAGLAISSRLLTLRCLRLGKLPRMTDAGFQGMSHLKHLQSLDVSECSLLSCSELVKAFGTSARPPELKSLNVAFCSLLRDSTVLSLAGALSKSLRVLDLSSCVSLSNRSVQAIASSLLLLTVLRLAWCKELTDWGLLGIGEPREECERAKEDLEKDKMMVINLNQQKAQEQRPTSLNALTRLQELDLTACGKLTDMSIAKVISFPDLRYLSLSLVPNITDTSLLAIARNCRSLEHLSLSHCTNLTDRGFAEAAGALCRLQHLILSGCNQLTPRTLKSVGQECQLLKSLDVSMCSKISMSDVERFQSQLPPQSQTSVQSRFVGGADLSITL